MSSAVVASSAARLASRFAKHTELAFKVIPCLAPIPSSLDSAASRRAAKIAGPFQVSCSYADYRQPSSSRRSFRTMATSADARVVPVAVAKELLTAGHRYLDVRTPEEFADGHVEGAVNVPFMFKKDGGMVKNDSFLTDLGSKFSKEDEIVVACQSGRRSAMAASDLVAAGYTGITDMAGGFSSWVSSGLPMVK